MLCAYLALLFANLVGRLFFQRGRFASQFEFGTGCVVLNIICEIIRTRQRLAGNVHLTAGAGERR